MGNTALTSDIFILDQAEFNALSGSDIHLCLEASVDRLSIAFFNKRTHCYFGFESFQFFESNTFQGAQNELEKAIADSSLAQHGFGSASFSIHNKWSTLIPKALFNTEMLSQYLELNFEFIDNCKYLHQPLQNNNAENVFAIPKGIWRAAKKQLVNVDFYHFSGFLIDSLLLKYKNVSNCQVILNTGEETFQMIVIENQELKLYNQFKFQHEDDLVYFVMFALEQLKINRSSMKISAMGHLSLDSRHLLKLAKYAGNVEEEEFNIAISSGFNIEKSLQSQHYSLFNHHLCV